MDRPVFSNNNTPSDDVSANNKAAFEITPAAGRLIPLDVSCFNITFKPTEVVFVVYVHVYKANVSKSTYFTRISYSFH